MIEKRKLPDPAEVRIKEVLSPEELGTLLGCGRTTAYALLRSGEIPSFTIGRLRRVRRQDAEGYIETRIAQAC